MARSDDRRRRDINEQAWKDIEPTIRDLYEQRRRELLSEAGLVPYRARRRREHDFRLLVCAILDDPLFDHADHETLDLVSAFLHHGTIANRRALYRHLMDRPELLGQRAAQFFAFAWDKI